MLRESRRLTLALLISLLLHSLLLSLTFGGSGVGLPGLSLPWQMRRAEVPEVRIVLMAVQAPVVSREFGPPQPVPTMRADANADAATVERLRRAPSQASTPPSSDIGSAAPALAPAGAATWVVRTTPDLPAPVIAAAPTASSAEAATSPPRLNTATAPPQAEPAVPLPATEPRSPAAAAPEIQRDLAEPSTAPPVAIDEVRERAETAPLDAARHDAARAAAVRQEAARMEAARADAERLETERQEAARQQEEGAEATRLEASYQEAIRQAAVGREASRQQALRMEAASAENARLGAESRAAAATGAEAARLRNAREAETKREATLRAIGRQLDEEAAQRDAEATAARSSTSPAAASRSARRARLFGRTDSNAELILYAEAWGRKIQLNMAFDMVREAATLPHNDAVVTVAMRSDGSVESVTFVRSSGVAAIDDAIRRIVHSQTPYPAFTPGLAREYDVIEIRRTWTFDMAIRLN